MGRHIIYIIYSIAGETLFIMLILSLFALQGRHSRQLRAVLELFGGGGQGRSGAGARQPAQVNSRGFCTFFVIFAFIFLDF